MVYSCFIRVMDRLVESYREAKNALVNTNISWRTYSLIACFALSSWITVNGVWSELPVIVIYAPEKWQIASYTVVIIQLGFAGPLLYSLANRLCPRIFTEKLTIYLLFLIGILSCFFLALWFKKTTKINGKPHSLALMILVFTLALVDCTSSVVFLTFMALYDPRYITALYIGESFCGLLPGLAAIIQGSPAVRCNSNSSYTANSTHGNSTTHTSDAGLLFSASTYFIILLVMMLFSGFAFLALNFLPFAVKEKFREEVAATNQTIQPSDSTTDKKELIGEELEPAVNYACSCLSSRKLVMLFFLQAIVCSFTFGILPSLSPYAFEPYGMASYHLGMLLPVWTFNNLYRVDKKVNPFKFKLAIMYCSILTQLIPCQIGMPTLKYNSQVLHTVAHEVSNNLNVAKYVFRTIYSSITINYNFVIPTPPLLA